MKYLPKILIVDDKPNNIVALEAIFVDIEAELVKAHSGEEALKALLHNNFALAILDVQMPEMDGYELAALIRNRKKTATFPIIFVSAIYSDEFHIFKGYDSGGVDFITKPISPKILVNKVRVFLGIDRQRKKLQDARDCIAAQNRMLEERATRDGLTGLHNHAHFQKMCKREFDLAKRYGHPLTVLMCDLDYFKDVNDTYGHQTGDMVLREVASIIMETTRSTDITARYGGEEFVLALSHTDGSNGRKRAEILRAAVEAHSFRYKKSDIHITISIGVATLDDFHTNHMELVEQADVALYKAKENGRNQVCDGSPVRTATRQVMDADFEKIRLQLKNIVTKNRSSILASFTGLVHSNCEHADLLEKRNEKALQLVGLLGRRLNLSHEILHSFRHSFKIHDLFRLYIRDSSFGSGQPLPPRSRQAVINQPLLMKKLIDYFDLFAAERQILLHHHEHYDGSGYPGGLSEDEIPMGSRIFAIVDAVIAMLMPTYPREYISRDRIIAELQKQAGRQFDPLLVQLIIMILRENDF